MKIFRASGGVGVWLALRTRGEDKDPVIQLRVSFAASSLSRCRNLHSVLNSVFVLGLCPGPTLTSRLFFSNSSIANFSSSIRFFASRIIASHASESGKTLVSFLSLTSFMGPIPFSVTDRQTPVDLLKRLTA